MGCTLTMSDRVPWQDRFRRPTMKDLSSPYNSRFRRLLESARERLCEDEAVAEELSWQGVPWRWTLVFRRKNDPTKAWAYLVPDPEGPKITVPLTHEMVRSLPMRRLKKHVRDSVQGAGEIAGTYWATFNISNLTQLDEVLDIAERKRKFIEKS